MFLFICFFLIHNTIYGSALVDTLNNLTIRMHTLTRTITKPLKENIPSPIETSTTLPFSVIPYKRIMQMNTDLKTKTLNIVDYYGSIKRIPEKIKHLFAQETGKSIDAVYYQPVEEIIPKENPLKNEWATLIATYHTAEKVSQFLQQTYGDHVPSYFIERFQNHFSKQYTPTQPKPIESKPQPEAPIPAPIKKEPIPLPKPIPQEQLKETETNPIIFANNIPYSLPSAEAKKLFDEKFGTKNISYTSALAAYMFFNYEIMGKDNWTLPEIELLEKNYQQNQSANPTLYPYAKEFIIYLIKKKNKKIVP